MAKPWVQPPAGQFSAPCIRRRRFATEGAGYMPQRCEGCGEEVDRSAVRCSDCELAIIRSARGLGPLVSAEPCPCRHSAELEHRCDYFHGSGREAPADGFAGLNNQARPSEHYHGTSSGAPYHPLRRRSSTTRAKGPSPD